MQKLSSRRPLVPEDRAARAVSFRDLFLGPEDLPPGMRCVRDARDGGAPPGDRPSPVADGQDAGWAMWMAPPDADLYRLDDTRWLFTDARDAASYYWQLVAHEGSGTTSPPTGGQIPSGVERDVFRCTRGTEVYLLLVGPLVAELRACPGEGSSLPGTVMAKLAEAVERRARSLTSLPTVPTPTGLAPVRSRWSRVLRPRSGR